MFSKFQVLGSLAACAMLVACGSGGPLNTSPEKRPAAPIRFDYQVHNRDNVGLIRAFDDGQKTILQFQNLENLPVEAFDSDNNSISGVRRIGSYLVLPKIYRTVFLRMKGRESVVVRDSADNPDTILGEPIRSANTASAMPVEPAGKPSPIHNTPAQVAAVQTTPASTLPPGEAVTAGQAAGTVLSPTATATNTAAAAPAVKKWYVKQSDRTLRQTLNRWAAEANKDLPAGEPQWRVSWEVERKHDARFETTYTGTIKDATLGMMRDLMTSDYPLASCFYANRVIRVIRNGDIAKCKAS